jgi:hypothetical protein
MNESNVDGALATLKSIADLLIAVGESGVI